METMPRTAQFKRLAQLAQGKAGLPRNAWQHITSLLDWQRGVAPVMTRGRLADLEFLRGQVPLPETADELCKVALDIGESSARSGLARTPPRRR